MSEKNVVLEAIDEMKSSLRGQVKDVRDEVTSRVESLEDQIKEFKKKAGKLRVDDTRGILISDHLKNWIRSDFDNISKLAPGDQYRYEIKSPTAMLTSSHLSGDVFVSNVNRVPARSMYGFHLRDILSVIPVSTGSVNYPQESSPLGEGSFGEQTEGIAKPTVDYDITTVPLQLQFTAGISKVSRQMLQDLPFMEEYLSKSLTEDFLRREDTRYLNAIAADATTGSTSESLTAAKFLDYIGQVFNAGHTPTAIVTTVAGWLNVLKTKPNDVYSIPGAVKITDSGLVTIAGIPVYTSPLVTSGKAYVGDWSKAAIAQSGAFNIRSTEYNEDDFNKNMVSFRAEARVGLMEFSPYAFVFGSI